MAQYEKVSKNQLRMLVVGFLFGDSFILNLASHDVQHSWISFSCGLAGGFILICMYIYIYVLNNQKSLIGILKNCFGKYLGTAIGLGYIWYFIHLAALVSKNFSDFLILTNYYDTPGYFVTAVIFLIVLYMLKKGLTVTARSSEFFVIILILGAIIFTASVIQFYDIEYFFPLWNWHIIPMLQDSFAIFTFPFGETIVFLMIFPSIAEIKHIKKAASSAVLIAGIVILNIMIRDLLVLGAHMIPREIYPVYTAISLTSPVDFGLFLATSLSISCIYKVWVCTYASVLAISEIFNLPNYKTLTLPIVLIVNVLTNASFERTKEMYDWLINIWPYYSIPFQIVIPLFILGVSILKRARTFTFRNQ